MLELIKPEFPNFGRYCLERGGKIKELYIPVTNTNWPGLCNPSIYNDNGQLRCIIRNINFIMHVSADESKNWSDWGPLLYANHKDDGRLLKTRNFLATINDDLNITDFKLINTTQLDKDPIWEFVGLEDARLLRWNGELYGIGVRRDDNTTGQGRMEISHINEIGEELDRVKINHELFDYCEKNWVPVLDEPFTFVRFSYPTCIVKTDDKGILQSIKEYPVPEGITLGHDMQLRGSSQVMRWKDYRIGLFHTCNLCVNDLDKKYARYHYQFVVWDLDWNIVKVSKLFCFNDFHIEFSNGMCIKDGKFIFSFAMQDNMSFLMSVDEGVVEDFIFDKTYQQPTNTPSNNLENFFFYDKNPKVLYDYGIELYNRGMLVAAHALLERSADYSKQPYNAWFMKTRCIADIGNRDGFELDGWFKLLMMDPNRPEAYLALSNYYIYRGEYNQAYYFARLAYIYKDNACIYYNDSQYTSQYIYSMIFTERRDDARQYLNQIQDNNIREYITNILDNRKIHRIL